MKLIALAVALASASFGQALPKIVKTVFVEINDQHPKLVEVGWQFSTRIIVGFQTDVPLSSGVSAAAFANFLDGRNSGAALCGSSWSTAPVVLNNWYTFECSNLDRSKTITEVFIRLTSAQVQSERIAIMEMPSPVTP